MSDESPKKKFGGAQENAGRKPSQVRLSVQEMLVNLNYNPLAELVRVASDPATDIVLKVSIDKDLLNYEFAKKKQIAHDHGLGTPDEVQTFLKALSEQGRPKPPTKVEKKPDEPKRPRGRPKKVVE